MNLAINDITILVMSCDQNKDTFYPFHHCMEKYWSQHPPIIYSTETVNNTYYKTISYNYPIGLWTRRIQETLKQISTKFVLVMVDDVFIRDYVDNEKILNLCSQITGNVAAFNLEKTFDKNDLVISETTCQRALDGKYQTSVMCSIYDRAKLINILNFDADPWKFERTNNTCGYLYFINRNQNYISWGWDKRQWFGIRKGKWCLEIKDFFQKEDLKIDYSIRGFYK